MNVCNFLINVCSFEQIKCDDIINNLPFGQRSVDVGVGVGGALWLADAYLSGHVINAGLCVLAPAVAVKAFQNRDVLIQTKEQVKQLSINQIKRAYQFVLSVCHKIYQSVLSVCHKIKDAYVKWLSPAFYGLSNIVLIMTLMNYYFKVFRLAENVLPAVFVFALVIPSVASIMSVLKNRTLITTIKQDLVNITDAVVGTSMVLVKPVTVLLTIPFLVDYLITGRLKNTGLLLLVLNMLKDAYIKRDELADLVNSKNVNDFSVRLNKFSSTMFFLVFAYDQFRSSSLSPYMFDVFGLYGMPISFAVSLVSYFVNYYNESAILRARKFDC